MCSIQTLRFLTIVCYMQSIKNFFCSFWKSKETSRTTRADLEDYRPQFEKTCIVYLDTLRAVKLGQAHFNVHLFGVDQTRPDFFLDCVKLAFFFSTMKIVEILYIFYFV